MRQEVRCSLGATVLHTLDIGTECAESFVDAFVATLDLTDVVDDALALGAQRREQHGHSRTNVGRLDATAMQLVRADDDGPMRITEHNARTHADELIDKEQARLE